MQIRAVEGENKERQWQKKSEIEIGIARPLSLFPLRAAAIDLTTGARDRGRPASPPIASPLLIYDIDLNTLLRDTSRLCFANLKEPCSFYCRSYCKAQLDRDGSTGSHAGPSCHLLITTPNMRDLRN